MSDASKTPSGETGLIYDPAFLLHDTGPGHPESAQRYTAVMEALAQSDLPLRRLPWNAGTIDDVLLCHASWYHDVVKMDAEHFAEVLRTGDTAICPDSHEVAMDAVGAVLSAVNAVVDGEVANAFCAVRPPGHHASHERGMGFCIFNNVAIAARHLQRRRGVERVAILDWDVHHGNGTQDLFYEEGSVFFASSHEDDIFPHTGAAEETGAGPGEGTTLNLPVPQHSDGRVLIPLWQDSIGPALREFRPDFLLLSAGFDARVGDPVGMLNLEDEDFAALTRLVCTWAHQWCGGRVVSVLEGGYDPQGLATAVIAHVQELVRARDQPR